MAAEQGADLDGGQAGAAACAENGQCFAGLEPGALDETVHRGAIGHEKPGGLRVIKGIRHAYDRPRGDRDLFTRSTMPEPYGDTLADAPAFDIAADRADDARAFACWREGQGRLGLVAILDDQRVEEVQRRRLDGDDDLAWARLRIGQFTDHQVFCRPVGLAKQCFHLVAPSSAWLVPAIPSGQRWSPPVSRRIVPRPRCGRNLVRGSVIFAFSPGS